MIPTSLVHALAPVPPLLLEAGGIILVLLVAVLGVLAVLFVPLGRPVVVLAVLRTVADLARMGCWSALARNRRRP